MAWDIYNGSLAPTNRVFRQIHVQQPLYPSEAACPVLQDYPIKPISLVDNNAASLMATVKQPLGDYLRRENPTLVCRACPPGSNTTSRIVEYLIPDHIKDWTDFQYESLRSIYGGVLNQVLESEFLCQDFSAIPQKPFREIYDERSLESLLTKWNHSVVSEALSKAQEQLYTNHSNMTIYMATGGQSRIPELVKEKRFPDWAGIQPALSQADVQGTKISSINILPGDTKVSKKWLSDDIVDGALDTDYTPDNWQRPLKQVYTYCVRANARYGYIITDKELVVIRIGPSTQEETPASTQESSQGFDVAQTNSEMLEAESSKGCFEYDEGNHYTLPTPIFNKLKRDGGMLEYKAIPWTNGNEGNPLRAHDSMTVNLALWWLHMMASVSSTIKERYAPLREIAPPSCFGAQNSNPHPSSTSDDSGPKIPNTPRKRSHSPFMHGATARNDANNGKPINSEGSPKRPKRERKLRLGQPRDSRVH